MWKNFGEEDIGECLFPNLLNINFVKPLGNLVNNTVIINYLYNGNETGSMRSLYGFA